ncbi:MAG: hypothetical protein KDB82_15830 [Planctomycetes bacterium]|nr:hypothetical protein [Planctomycetota bacterium]
MSGTASQPEIPEERRFVWRNLDAFLSGELSEADRARVEAFLCECPYTREYVETEQQFAEAVRRCVNEAPVACPEGLRDRILTALDRCEVGDDDDAPAQTGAAPDNVLRFPWLGVVMMAAASIILLVSLFMLTTRGAGAENRNLQRGLEPMVAHLEMNCPRGGKCQFVEADKTYQQYFADGPALPHELDGATMKVARYECVEWQGERVMCAVYDAPDGERFGLIVFCSDCVKGVVPNEVQAAELKVDGKTVVMWREGKYIRALVGDDEAILHRHMMELRKTV